MTKLLVEFVLAGFWAFFPPRFISVLLGPSGHLHTAWVHAQRILIFFETRFSQTMCNSVDGNEFDPILVDDQ